MKLASFERPDEGDYRDLPGCRYWRININEVANGGRFVEI